MLMLYRILWKFFIVSCMAFFVTIGIAQAAVTNDAVSRFDEFFRAGQYKEAMSLAQDMLTAAEETAETNSMEYAYALERVGMVHKAQAEPDQAKVYYERALNVFEKEPVKDEINIAGVMTELGWLCLDTGDPVAAEKYYKEAITRYGKAGCDDNRLGKTLEDLGNMYAFGGKLSKAIPVYEETLKIYSRGVDPNNENAVRVTELLANLYLTVGNNVKAEEFCLKGTRYYRERPYAGYSPKISWFTKVGDIYATDGRYKEAVHYYLEAADAYQAAYKTNDSRAINCLSKAVQVCRRNGDEEQARSIELRVNKILDAQENTSKKD